MRIDQAASVGSEHASDRHGSRQPRACLTAFSGTVGLRPLAPETAHGLLKLRSRRRVGRCARDGRSAWMNPPPPSNKSSLASEKGDRSHPGTSQAIEGGTAVMNDEDIGLIEGSGNVFRDFGDSEVDLK